MLCARFASNDTFVSGFRMAVWDLAFAKPSRFHASVGKTMRLREFYTSLNCRFVLGALRRIARSGMPLHEHLRRCRPTYLPLTATTKTTSQFSSLKFLNEGAL